MIAEMRLQWWRDALEEIGQGKPVRKHEVTTPLTGILDSRGAQMLDGLVHARRWDIYKNAFEDESDFNDYLRQTGANLMWTAARLLGARDDARPTIEALGRGAALVRFLQAVPDLEARGRIPLVDGRPEAIAALADGALSEIPSPRVAAFRVPPVARPAMIEAWLAEPLLRQIVRDPARVAAGRVGFSEFRKRLRLLRWA
jgi:phytoene synthase